MNDLAGRLNEMPGRLFSLFVHGKGYRQYLVQPVDLYRLVNILESQGKMVETALEIGIRYERFSWQIK